MSLLLTGLIFIVICSCSATNLQARDSVFHDALPNDDERPVPFRRVRLGAFAENWLYCATRLFLHNEPGTERFWSGGHP